MEFDVLENELIVSVSVKTIEDFEEFEKELSFALSIMDEKKVRSFERAFTLALTSSYDVGEIIASFSFLKLYLTNYGLMGLSRGLKYEDFVRVRGHFRSFT